MIEDEMTEGYMDGLKARADELDAGSNRSESYRHGWRNGRDDRLGRPRATAGELRTEMAEIKERESRYL